MESSFAVEVVAHYRRRLASISSVLSKKHGINLTVDDLFSMGEEGSEFENYEKQKKQISARKKTDNSSLTDEDSLIERAIKDRMCRYIMKKGAKKGQICEQPADEAGIFCKQCRSKTAAKKMASQRGWDTQEETIVKSSVPRGRIPPSQRTAEQKPRALPKIEKRPKKLETRMIVERSAYLLDAEDLKILVKSIEIGDTYGYIYCGHNYDEENDKIQDLVPDEAVRKFCDENNIRIMDDSDDEDPDNVDNEDPDDVDNDDLE